MSDGSLIYSISIRSDTLSVTCGVLCGYVAFASPVGKNYTKNSKSLVLVVFVRRWIRTSHGQESNLFMGNTVCCEAWWAGAGWSLSSQSDWAGGPRPNPTLIPAKPAGLAGQMALPLCHPFGHCAAQIDLICQLYCGWRGVSREPRR